ncbi:MAG: hypothetical protein LUF90_11530 [Rikenellaceae bacterium]|nr:hypothetical protein [Rikenellaceae bacterium]
MKLGDIAIEIKSTYKGIKQNLPIVGLEHLIPNEIKLSSWEIDTDNTFTKQFKKGQVLLGRRRAYLKKAAVAPFDGICSGDITVIDAIPEKVSPDLLPFIIQNDRFFDYAVKGSAGSLSPRVKWEYLNNYEIDLPQIEEQERLAKLLWAAYELKESYKKLIVATDEMVKAQFIEMFGDAYNNSIGAPFDVLFTDITKLATKISQGDYLTNGKYPIFDQGQCYVGGYRNDEKGLSTNFPVIIFGDHTREIKFVNQPYFIGGDGVKVIGINSLELRSVFSFYLMKFCDIPNTGYNRHFKLLKNKSFVIPTIDEQIKFENFVFQADQSKFKLQQSIGNLEKVMKSLLP